MAQQKKSDQQLPLGKAETFRALFENATEGIMLSNQAGEILMANPVSYKLFGYKEGELIGRKIEELVPARFQGKHEEYRDHYFKQPKSRPMGGGMDLYAERKDGTEFPVEISLSYFKDGGNLYAISFIIDISGRKNQEHLLASEREKAQKYLDVAGNMFVALNKDGTIDMINRRGCEILGYEEKEVIGKNWFEHFIPERIQGELEGVFRQILKGEIGPVEYYENPIITKKDKERVVAFHNSVVSDDDGQIIGVLFSGEDITERKIIEDELREANRELKRYAKELKRSNAELEQFAYVASHDLQEPLRMVSSYTQLLAKRYKDQLDRDANEFITYAVNGAKRMQKLINDLLQFSRVGRKELFFKEVDLNEVVQMVCENLRKLIDETNAEIKIKTDLPTLQADNTQMIQLFQNLISNGIKFRGEAVPKINITAKKKEQYWQFSVEDNGIGINKTHQKRVFMIFQRLHTRHEYSGSGIGLALCRKIVERHDGDIWLESEKGKGTTFYFTISGKPAN